MNTIANNYEFYNFKILLTTFFCKRYLIKRSYFYELHSQWYISVITSYNHIVKPVSVYNIAVVSRFIYTLYIEHR